MMQLFVAADSREAWERLGMEKESGQVAEPQESMPEFSVSLRKARAYHQLPLQLPPLKEENAGTAELWEYTTIL